MWLRRRDNDLWARRPPPLVTTDGSNAAGPPVVATAFRAPEAAITSANPSTPEENEAAPMTLRSSYLEQEQNRMRQFYVEFEHKLDLVKKHQVSPLPMWDGRNPCS